MSDHHFPCPCGAELADECAKCARTNPLGSMRIEPAIGSEQVARFRQEREVAAAVRGIGPLWDDEYDDDFDPTDAELERSWNGPDAPEAHRAAWVLHQETRES